MTSPTWSSQIEGYIVGLNHTMWILLQATINTEEQRQAFVNLLEQTLEEVAKTDQATNEDNPRLPKYLEVTTEFLNLAREMQFPLNSDVG